MKIIDMLVIVLKYLVVPNKIETTYQYTLIEITAKWIANKEWRRISSNLMSIMMMRYENKNITHLNEILDSNDGCIGDHAGVAW